MSEQANDYAGASDELTPTLIKGPDPEVWGDDADRPPPGLGIHSVVGVGEVANEGQDDEVKGPAEHWEDRYDEDSYTWSGNVERGGA